MGLNFQDSGGMNYSVMAQDLGEFLDEHGLASASIIGRSVGGKVAMQFALEFSERVDKLVIVDIAPTAYPPTHRRLLMAMRSLDVLAFASFADADAALRQFLIKNLTGWRRRLSLARRPRFDHRNLR